MERSFFRFCLPVFILGTLIAASGAHPAFAEETPTELTAEEKAEKRLLFNQFVADEMAKVRKKQTEQQTAAAKNWTLKYSTALGYDSNVQVNSSRVGDGYFQNTFDATLKLDRPELPFWSKEGKWTGTLYSDFINYGSFERFSYNSTTVGLADEERLNNQVSVKLPVDLTVITYPGNNSVDYFSFRFKPQITHALTANLAHVPYVSAEYRLFYNLHNLGASNLYENEYRHDHYYEIGESLRFIPSNDIYIGASAGLKWNDSNDAFHNYSDYGGWKTNAFAYWKYMKDASVVAYAGYDYKEYDDRTFLATSQETEEHDFIYMGGTAYFDVSKNMQLFITYLFKENYCNNPAQEYSGYNTTVGLTFIF